MAPHDTMKRVLTGLLVLTALAAITDAVAQKKRLPSRTEEIPDTESGRPAASAERPTFKGRLLIYGPPVLPLGAPPEHSKPAPTEEVAEPKPETAPAPSASPAPVVAPPVVATPAPTPPRAPVVVVPVPPPPAPVAVTAPTPPPPAPVAVPIPTAPPVRIAAPAPVPTPPPAPAVAASALREPVVRDPIVREPVVRPEPVRSEPVRSEPVRPEPARPAAPATPPRQEIALAVPSSAPAAPAAPAAIEAKLIESVFNCLSPGLPPDWKRAWVEITDQGGGKEKNSKFRVSNIRDVADEGEPLVPCNAQALTGSIVGLNAKLPADRRAWTRALLVIDSDGEYELTYEYGNK